MADEPRNGWHTLDFPVDAGILKLLAHLRGSRVPVEDLHRHPLAAVVDREHRFRTRSEDAAAEQSGAAILAERAREELRVSGACLRDVSSLSGARALTPAEERIARLAADGMSNKQIAQHLFVTVGTVQTTLVHVYRKLGIAGRTEIAAAIGA